jgi:hypothetical protein
MKAQTAQWLVYAFVSVAVLATSAYSFRTQHISMLRYGDGDEYLTASEQIAEGRMQTTESPAIYRMALPWVVAKLFPKDIPHGYRVLNTIAGTATAFLLVVWLREWGVGPVLQMIVVLMFVASWLAPVRFVSFYPLYVDPPFLALSVFGLILIHRIRARWSWSRILLLAAVCFIGTLVRETMLFVACACAMVNVRLPRRAPSPNHVPLVARCLPLSTWVMAIEVTRAMPFYPRYSFSLFGNALFLFHTKALFTLPLAAFITVGPVLTLALYDWRPSARLLGEHFYLVVYSLGCLATGYVGGHETERYWLWAAPVAYVLIARSMARHKEALLHSAWVFVALVLAQAISERIFWSIPDPSLGVPKFGEWPWIWPRIYSVIDRLVVIDDYFWNLWSYFGSRPFHFVMLCIDAAFAGFLCWWLHAHPSTPRSPQANSGTA